MPNITCELAALEAVEYDIDGVCFVTIRWDWDGVSSMPNCDGPLVSVRLRNTSDVTYYVNLPAKKKGLRNFEIPPQSDSTFGAQQLKVAGLDTYQDTVGVTPHRVPLNFAGN